MEVLTPPRQLSDRVKTRNRSESNRVPRTRTAAGPRRRLGRVAAMMAVFHKLSRRQPAPVMRQRQLVADLCRLIGAHLGQPTRNGGRQGAGGPAPLAMLDDLGLSTRMRQTLRGLLAGEAEKQIAYRLNLSRHTVHVYVKALYRHFGVSSRGELLARFVRPDAGTN